MAAIPMDQTLTAIRAQRAAYSALLQGIIDDDLANVQALSSTILTNAGTLDTAIQDLDPDTGNTTSLS